ncbi:MAG: hypothetical protein E7167_02755 [Firmicutes bacterium]|nr:hypothetical protein [Bacillota bacterium]
MGRNFDPIDIIFIVLIGIYLLTLFAIILVLVYGKKDNKPVKYKVIEVISPPKKKKRKTKPRTTGKTTASTSKKKNSTKNNTTKKKATSQNNVRYKGKAPTKKKTAPRKKKPKTNGINKKRKK